MNTWLIWLQSVPSFLPWIFFIIFDLILIFQLLVFEFRFHNWWLLRKRKLVFLEVTPPARMERTALANNQLITNLYGLDASRSLKHKLLGRPVVLPLEAVATYDGGIRFIVPIEQHLAPTVLQTITTYMPDAKVVEVEDYLPSLDMSYIVEYKQKYHWRFSLAAHTSLDQHDPAAYLIGAMTNLKPGETMAFQLVGKPIKTREAATILQRIIRNENVLAQGSSHSLPVVSGLLTVINMVLLGTVEAIGSIWHAPSKHSVSMAQRLSYERQQIAKQVKPARTLSSTEQQLVDTMRAKVSQPLFSVSIRTMVIMDDPKAAQSRAASMRSSLESYSVPGYQALRSKLSPSFMQRYRRFVFQKRLPALFRRSSPILSASEVASLYHFPTNGDTKTDNLVTSLSRTLPAPLALKKGLMFDVVLGRNFHHGQETSIGLSAEERARHVYVIGGTGNGKTTMLQYGIIQDIENGRGVAVIDPHGDLAATILKHIPEERIKDVIYFNPDDLDHPIGLNLLEMTPGLTGNALLREKDKVTESVVSMFRKIFSEDDTGGHRIEYVLRNAILTAMTVEGATIFTILKLLQNTNYRKTVTDKLEDGSLKDFWKSDLGQAGNMQRVKMSLGVTSKLSRFDASASAKFILEQERSTIDFEDIINSGKILICNFAKGALGEDTAQLFGIATIAKLQLAAYRRVYMDAADRQPFYMYIDEFQNFATKAFEELLSEARKYKLFMTMAEQSLSQQDDQQMVKVILANVGTTICFKTGNPDDARLLMPKFTPFIDESDIQRLSAYNFFADLSAIHSQEPTSGKTVLLPDGGSKDVAAKVIAQSQAAYGKLTEVEEAPETVTKSTSSPEKNTKPKQKPTKQPPKENNDDEGNNDEDNNTRGGRFPETRPASAT
jgi:hypothetical protein